MAGGWHPFDTKESNDFGIFGCVIQQTLRIKLGKPLTLIGFDKGWAELRAFAGGDSRGFVGVVLCLTTGITGCQIDAMDVANAKLCKPSCTNCVKKWTAPSII